MAKRMGTWAWHSSHGIKGRFHLLRPAVLGPCQHLLPALFAASALQLPKLKENKSIITGWFIVDKHE